MAKAVGIGKVARIGAAQLGLHGGVDHPGGQAAHACAMGFERFFQRQRLREVVQPRFGCAVGRLAGHAAPAQARRDIEHLFGLRPVGCAL